MFLQWNNLTEQGFSFVELMIAITIVGIVLIPMSSMFDFGLRNQKRGEQELVALNLCQARLEKLLADYYQNDYQLLTPQIFSETVQLGQRYIIKTTVSEHKGRLQQFTVEVFYEDFGQEKSVCLTTRVVQY